MCFCLELTNVGAVNESIKCYDMYCDYLPWVLTFHTCFRCHASNHTHSRRSYVWRRIGISWEISWQKNLHKRFCWWSWWGYAFRSRTFRWHLANLLTTKTTWKFAIEYRNVFEPYALYEKMAKFRILEIMPHLSGSGSYMDTAVHGYRQVSHLD